ncbi:GntR family transcriptional regulator [Hypericibacter adhaerens]|jgi:GntR family transcriptional regulator/MocR family aminotransferase|uniref:GntR family transcriptional regulator n=1 Tax=Hypericibacter adhaerens TaxID=2602016 RepID=A0A5J6MVW5_9PROT|nr:PLP-dependent aminotransferase family protein [Hypericibacter adhaerens]QEX21263.1 GntR family transcriptional regulator [Hypericibacter adhaerens]HVY50231.1 PLP-dependent aminotransferase family protein [Devosia sp.]
MREQLFHFEPDGKTTLQAQLRRMLVDAILEGQIPAGTALPSCRKMAQTLNVARNTVALAYQDLVEEGFLVARQRSGYFVAPDVLSGRAQPPVVSAARETATGANAKERPAGVDWADRFRVRPTAQHNIEKPRNWQDYPFPFIYGQVDPALFPIAAWRDCSRQALGRGSVKEWSRDLFTEDDPLLVEQIRTRLLPRRGVRVGNDEILVTVGAQQALYLIASLLIDAGTRVGIEDPGYVDARNIFSLRGAELVPLAIDREGLVVDERLAACDYVYATPSHQFPTTATMSLARRRALLQSAAANDIVVVEDDYESEINHQGTPSPALKSLDRSGRVIFVASLSKTLAPGLRLGYMVGPEPFIREARALRRLMLRHPPANNQRTIALFLADGHHDALLRRLSQIYKDRWKAMGEALTRHLPECRWQQSQGGTAYWVEGPPGLDARLLEAAAAKQGILIERGDWHFQAQDAPRRFFRLGFSSIALEKIEPGIKLLGEILRKQMG